MRAGGWRADIWYSCVCFEGSGEVICWSSGGGIGIWGQRKPIATMKRGSGIQLKTCQVWVLSFEAQHEMVTHVCWLNSGHVACRSLWPNMSFAVSLALNLPTNGKMFVQIYRLEKLMEEIVTGWVRYSATHRCHTWWSYPAPCCSHMSRWWEHGPENNPEGLRCAVLLWTQAMLTHCWAHPENHMLPLVADEGAWEEVSR